MALPDYQNDDPNRQVYELKEGCWYPQTPAPRSEQSKLWLPDQKAQEALEKYQWKWVTESEVGECFKTQPIVSDGAAYMVIGEAFRDKTERVWVEVIDVRGITDLIRGHLRGISITLEEFESLSQCRT